MLLLEETNWAHGKAGGGGGIKGKGMGWEDIVSKSCTDQMSGSLTSGGCGGQGWGKVLLSLFLTR